MVDDASEPFTLINLVDDPAGFGDESADPVADLSAVSTVAEEPMFKMNPVSCYSQLI